jgi:hypothetical protein
MRRLGDTELPLPLCLSWVEKGGVNYVENYSYVLQENDTGEIMASVCTCTLIISSIVSNQCKPPNHLTSGRSE